MSLIRNAIRTPDGTVLNSINRHDYRSHKDENGSTYMTDGGLDYIRRSMNGDEIDLSLTTDEPHSVQREVLRWGTYGKKGDEPLQHKPIALMDTGHIEAVLDECTPAGVYKECMQEELRLRGIKSV